MVWGAETRTIGLAAGQTLPLPLADVESGGIFPRALVLGMMSSVCGENEGLFVVNVPPSLSRFLSQRPSLARPPSVSPLLCISPLVGLFPAVGLSSAVFLLFPSSRPSFPAQSRVDRLAHRPPSVSVSSFQAMLTAMAEMRYCMACLTAPCISSKVLCRPSP